MTQIKEGGRRYLVQLGGSFAEPYDVEYLIQTDDFEEAKRVALDKFEELKGLIADAGFGSYKYDLTIKDNTDPLYWIWLLKENRYGEDMKDHVIGYILDPRTEKIIDMTQSSNRYESLEVSREARINEEIILEPGDKIVIVEGNDRERKIESVGKIKVHLVGSPRKTDYVEAWITERNWNPANDTVILPDEIDGFAGPMFNGTRMVVDGVEYKVFDRFETWDAYDFMSR
jgi:hypothetical protein